MKLTLKQERGNALLVNESGLLVASCYDNMKSALWADDNIQNAEEIMRAVNAAPELVEALSALLEFADAGTPVHPGAEVWQEARAALAKAGI